MTEQNVANSLLDRHWANQTLPVDPVAIARAEGVPVYSFDLDEVATASGWYKFVNGKPAIFFNPTEVETRRRFTVAHELGHHVLKHGPRPRDGAAEFNLLNYDPLEASANRFAAELLMPAVAVRSFVVDRGIASLHKLAEIFNVSEVAMKYRLTNLGLIA